MDDSRQPMQSELQAIQQRIAQARRVDRQRLTQRWHRLRQAAARGQPIRGQLNGLAAAI